MFDWQIKLDTFMYLVGQAAFSTLVYLPSVKLFQLFEIVCFLGSNLKCLRLDKEKIITLINWYLWNMRFT